MKHALRTALVAGFLTASWAAMGQVAEAGTLTLARDRTQYQGEFGGGEFKVVTYDCSTVASMGTGVNLGGVFQTFCLERDEHLDFQGALLDCELNTEAVAGGVGGPSPDPLDGRTAYLFNRFWNGTLDDEGYDYTAGAGRVDSATALQLAIWYFEEELGAGSDQEGNPIFDITAAYNGNALAKHFVDVANANADANDIGQVRVLNLTRDDHHGLQHQDVLVVTAVPLPSAALLGLGLMSGVGAFELIRRRRRTFA